MKRRLEKPTTKQATPAELLESLLNFVQNKFYPGHPVEFAKDRTRLLDWVILYPATYLDDRGVTVSTTRYGEIVKSVLMDAARLGQTEKVTYFPAWLAKVIQSHFAMHGEEIYYEAKNIRTLVESAVLLTGKHLQPAPDVVKEFVQAKRLLTVAKGAKKRQSTPPLKQLGFNLQ